MPTLRMVCVIVAVFLGLTSAQVEAQRLAVSYSPSFLFTVTDVVNLATGVVESREARGMNGAPVFTSDGRFLLLRFFDSSGPSSVLEIRDLVSGVRNVIPVQFQPRRAHPRRLAAYGLVSQALARLDAGGVRLYAACQGTSVSELELALDGSRLLVLCATGTIEAIDEASGARLSVVSGGSTARFTVVSAAAAESCTNPEKARRR